MEAKCLVQKHVAMSLGILQFIFTQLPKNWIEATEKKLVTPCKNYDCHKEVKK